MIDKFYSLILYSYDYYEFQEFIGIFKNYDNALKFYERHYCRVPLINENKCLHDAMSDEEDDHVMIEEISFMDNEDAVCSENRDNPINLIIDDPYKPDEISGETSDGYHTFNELYDHRHALFISLMRSHIAISWRANNHDDGSNYKGYFVAGMHLPTGDISYHLPSDLWTELDNTGIKTSNRAPKWDGHAGDDVVKRLIKWGCQTTTRD